VYLRNVQRSRIYAILVLAASVHMGTGGCQRPFTPRYALEVPEYREAAERALSECISFCKVCDKYGLMCDCRVCYESMYEDWTDDAHQYLLESAALWECLRREGCSSETCDRLDEAVSRSIRSAIRVTNPADSDLIPGCGDPIRERLLPVRIRPNVRPVKQPVMEWD
jgi:hypothetical protein